MALQRGFVNVMILSWGFMLVFTAFQTMSNIEKTVLNSIKKDDPSFSGDGYTSLAIIYAVFALCNWFAPSYISVTGPRSAIFTGCLGYAFFISSFLSPSSTLLYVASVVVGLGAALIWTGHGQCLTENSTEETMSRNAGIFWAIFQSSMFVGNIFVFFTFTEEDIDASTRGLVFKVLTVLAVAGTLVLVLMRAPPHKLSLGEAEGVSSADKELQMPQPPREKPLVAAWHALRDAMKLFLTVKMLLLSLTFVYTGFALTFFSGVYSSSIGFTVKMGESRKSLVGMSGICIGIGEVFGGAIFSFLGSKSGRGCSGWPVVTTGFFCHLAAYISIFLNLPNDAPFQDTVDIGFIDPIPALAMIGSLFLGFGDACYNTQIYSLLGTLYAKESAPAFALFKFCQSVATAGSFYYSSHLGLHAQLAILSVVMVIGTIAFYAVEIKHRRAKRNEMPEIDPALVDTASVED